MQNGGMEPCLECPAVKLDAWLTQTIPGRRIALVMEMDLAKHAGVVYGPDDLLWPELQLLEIVITEREVYQAERIEEASKKRK